MGLVKQIDIKNWTYYFYNDIIDIKKFDSNLLKIDKDHIKTLVFTTCHDLMQKAMGFNNVAIVYIKENAHRIHFWYMSKDDAINIMTGSNLVHKRGASFFYYL